MSDYDYSRAPIPNEMKSTISDALKAIPTGKRGALLIIATEDGTQAHLAANINDNWKVAAGVSMSWVDKKPVGFVGIQGAW